MDEPCGSHVTFLVCLLLFFHRERSRAPRGRVGAGGPRGALLSPTSFENSGAVLSQLVRGMSTSTVAVSVPTSHSRFLWLCRFGAFQPSPAYCSEPPSENDVMGSLKGYRKSSQLNDFNTLYSVGPCCWLSMGTTPCRPGEAAPGLEPLSSPPFSPLPSGQSVHPSPPSQGLGPRPAPGEGREAKRKESRRNRRAKGVSSEKQGHRALRRTKGHLSWPLGARGRQSGRAAGHGNVPRQDK